MCLIRTIIGDVWIDLVLMVAGYGMIIQLGIGLSYIHIFHIIGDTAPVN